MGDSMQHRVQESHRRSVAKAISWRILGSLDTMLLAYLFTGSMVVAGSIATTESLTKIVLYYLHERAWAGFSSGTMARLWPFGFGRRRERAEGDQGMLSPGTTT